MVDILVLSTADVTDDIAEHLSRLIQQLGSEVQLDAAQVRAVTSREGVSLMIAVCEDEVVGTMTMTEQILLSGAHVTIEDLVVHDSLRRSGIGSALITTAIERARRAGFAYVDLTSRPSRVAANRLYRRLGFVRRETNVYRMLL